MLSTQPFEVIIDRYNPDTKKQYQQTYHVDGANASGAMLLDLLELIKVEDPTLSFRRSCGGGVCGSDGMNINGKNGLACQTQLNTLPKKVVLRPLPGLPIVRDLIVDMELFYRHYETGKPFLINDQLPEDGKERLQSEEARQMLDGLYECIMCACCTSSCPSFWWNPDKFLGPASLLAICRFVMDSRDTAKQERLALLSDLYSLYRCRGIMNCTTVCPKGLNPSEAISKLRTEMLQASSDSSS